MHTPSHIIFNLGILWWKKKQKFHFPIFLGAVLPDVTMYLFVGYEKVLGKPLEMIFDHDYFLPFWQNCFDLGHSFPLLAFWFWICYYLKKHWWKYLFASMFIHSLFDFPLHHDDAHRHFWPFSDYRFYSPISYWDPAHYGNIFSKLELVGVLLISFYLYWAMKTWYGKAGLVWLNVIVLGGVVAFSIWL